MQSALQVTSDDPTGGKESGVASSKSQALLKGCCEWVAFKVKFQGHGKVPQHLFQLVSLSFILGDVYGQILINGKQVTKQLMTRVSGFVPQQDLSILSLTVLEHMQLMVSTDFKQYNLLIL